MLSQLTIRNFAIVDHLQIEWHPGLNIITGETGAGKSILIDAVGALLGDRLGPEIVRSGAARALVEGVFTFGPAAAAEPPTELKAVFDQYGLEPEDGALIVSREIAGSGGRGGARINGRGVPLSVLRELGELLVDVHGQSEHMALLRAREQMDYLDRYAGVLGERSQVARLLRELRATRDTRRQLVAQTREVARQQEMLRHELAEIEGAHLRDDEENDLQLQRDRLRHAERLRQAALVAHQALMGGEEDGREQPGAVDLLGSAVSACQDAGKIDPTLAGEGEALSTALIQVEESARALRDYVDALEVDPRALEETAERLFLIGDLKRKYGESIPEVLGYAAKARHYLAAIEHRSERLDQLLVQEQQLTEELGAAAGTLSALRCAAAEKLSASVGAELADLRLAGARFVVAVAQTDETDGIPVGGRTLAVDPAGVDRIEFLIAANATDEPRPIARVASGGELARIALALKTVLSRVETRPTLIFDEIDVGVGGRTAPVVGQKLWAVAAAGHQVLCVTHMPQVAAFADRHLVVSRTDPRAGAETTVTVSADNQRVEELAAMLAGTTTDAARQSARELLGRATTIKAKGGAHGA
ncbi:MAG: DNA repair protein RecN [Chloroflexi bacterium]|nr:DNA repair protein RecN [Chloroflexota bacterium]